MSGDDEAQPLAGAGSAVSTNAIWPPAEMTYYDHPGGGFVFSVGSMCFGGSLVVNNQLQNNQ